VPSRARLGAQFLPSSVGDQASVDDVGESAFEAAQGFHGGLAFVPLAPVVGAGRHADDMLAGLDQALQE
jgi:hypothetical protein